MLTLPAPCAMVVDDEPIIDIGAVLRRQREIRANFYAPRQRSEPAKARDWIIIPATLPDQDNFRKSSVENVITAVGRFYGISRRDLISARRTSHIVRPRQVAMYLAKTLTLRSLPEIGRRMGGRDHTTVLHAVRKIDKLLETDAALQAEIADLRGILAPEQPQ